MKPTEETWIVCNGTDIYLAETREPLASFECEDAKIDRLYKPSRRKHPLDLQRAGLAAAAPELYRALKSVLESYDMATEECAWAREALRKADGL